MREIWHEIVAEWNGEEVPCRHCGENCMLYSFCTDLWDCLEREDGLQ